MLKQASQGVYTGLEVEGAKTEHIEDEWGGLMGPGAKDRGCLRVKPPDAG